MTAKRVFFFLNKIKKRENTTERLVRFRIPRVLFFALLEELENTSSYKSDISLLLFSPAFRRGLRGQQLQLSSHTSRYNTDCILL